MIPITFNTMKKAPYVFEFEEGYLPKTTNGMTSFSWHQKHKESKKWNAIVCFHLIATESPKEPLKKAKLTLTRHSTTQPDYDNLVSSFKIVIDALRHNRVLAEDKMQNIGIPEYKWEKAKKNEGKITVRVEEIFIDEKTI